MKNKETYEDTKNLMDSGFIMCVDNANAEDDLEEHGVYQVENVVVVTNNTPFASMVHVCFELIGKPGKKYHHSRFKIFAFSPN